MCLPIFALRRQVSGAEPSFQVIDIRGEGLPETAERNGGAVCGWSAVLAAVGNFGGGAYSLPSIMTSRKNVDAENVLKNKTHR